jgi:hypothetical protein
MLVCWLGSLQGSLIVCVVVVVGDCVSIVGENAQRTDGHSERRIEVPDARRRVAQKQVDPQH